jgi:hypothetical protein
LINKKVIDLLKKVMPNFIFFLLINIYTFFFYKSFFKKNKNLKNISVNKRGFLLATGPSVKNINILKLRNEDCFTLSSFFLHKKIKKIKPKFHFLAPYHKPILIKDWIKWIKLADNNIPKQTKFVLSIKDKKNINKYNLLKNREIFYLYFSSFVKLNNKIDLTKPLPAMITSPLMALPFMIYMGYKEIFLIGCDSDNLKNYGKQIMNFYNENLSVIRGASKPWHLGIIKELENNLRMFRQYKNYADYAKINNIKIINLSKESWLDFFEKKNFNKTLN